MPSLERIGMNMLLMAYPEHDVIGVVRTDVWTRVNLQRPESRRFDSVCIWRHTGAVYRMTREGAVVDDPFFVPEGSPYEGPREEIPSLTAQDSREESEGGGT